MDRALAISGRSGGRAGRARRFAPGAVWVTPEGRCGCTHARSRWSKGTAARCPTSWTSSSPCLASATTRPARCSASPSDNGIRSWTPTCAGWWPGCATASRIGAIGLAEVADSVAAAAVRGGAGQCGHDGGGRAGVHRALARVAVCARWPPNAGGSSWARRSRRSRTGGRKAMPEPIGRCADCYSPCCASRPSPVPKASARPGLDRRGAARAGPCRAFWHDGLVKAHLQ